MDAAFRIADAEALPTLFQLLREEGLCLGASSAINICGAMALARRLGPGHTIVTISLRFRGLLSIETVQPRVLEK